MTGEKGWSLDSHGPARVEVMFGALEWVSKLNRSDSELRLGERQRAACVLEGGCPKFKFRLSSL